MSKKAQLRESLKETLELALECYPEFRKMLKKDMTTDRMVSDIMSSLEEFTPEKLKGMQMAKIKLAQKIKQATQKLKI